MLFPEFFHRLLEAGASDITCTVSPNPSGYGYDTLYQLVWSYSGKKYGYQYCLSARESSSVLMGFDHILSVLSDNAMTSIHHAKSIIVFKESK